MDSFEHSISKRGMCAFRETDPRPEEEIELTATPTPHPHSHPSRNSWTRQSLVKGLGLCLRAREIQFIVFKVNEVPELSLCAEMNLLECEEERRKRRELRGATCL